jgi:allophanate hydrolase subunit 1
VKFFHLALDGGFEFRREALFDHRFVCDFVEQLFVLAIHEEARYHRAMQLRSAGDRAVLIELGDVSAAELHAAARYVRSLDGIERVTPGHSSLYVCWQGVEPPSELFLPWPSLVTDAVQDIPVRTIQVVFDGEDLEEFLESHALSRDTFLERVQLLTLTARYLGFRAGFAYLDGWPEEWAMPRRATSRPVRRGAFAIAGTVAGFYPIDTPGGWNILGSTDEDLEDAIEPGEQLRIAVATHHNVRTPRPRPSSAQPRAHRFELIRSPLVFETDRPFDEVLAAVALRAVSSTDGRRKTLLECPMVAANIRFEEDCVIAWCDAHLHIEHVRAGEQRSFGVVRAGFRGYLAIGDGEGERTVIPQREDRLVMRVARGPHDVGIDQIECEVTPQLNRIGIRLRPLEPLALEIPGDLRSIGMQCGTVQLHPDGSLVVMGPDHPVTGGYLQPMTVLSAERWKLAQLKPGELLILKIV